MAEHTGHSSQLFPVAPGQKCSVSWKQLLAVSLRKLSNLGLQLLGEFRILEASIAGSSKRKLSLAGSSNDYYLRHILLYRVHPI